MLEVHDIWFIWVYESEAPLIVRGEDRARFLARKLHGTCACLDPRSISNYGVICITDSDKLEDRAG